MNNPKEKQESTEQIAKERDLIDDGHQIIDKISHHAKTSIDDAVEGAEETLNKAGDDLVDAVRSAIKLPPIVVAADIIIKLIIVLPKVSFLVDSKIIQNAIIAPMWSLAHSNNFKSAATTMGGSLIADYFGWKSTALLSLSQFVVVFGTWLISSLIQCLIVEKCRDVVFKIVGKFIPFFMPPQH
jgi:hypothetical protein